MKYFFNKALMLFVLTVMLFVACSDDDPEDLVIDVASVIEYDGQSYDIDKGYIVPLGKHNLFDRFLFNVYLTSANVSYDKSTKSSFTGTGEILKLQFFTEDENGLTDGVYNHAYRTDPDEMDDVLSFTGVLYLSDYDLANNAGTQNSISDGEIKINKTGDRTIFSFIVSDSTLVGNAAVVFEQVEDIKL